MNHIREKFVLVASKMDTQKNLAQDIFFIYIERSAP